MSVVIFDQIKWNEKQKTALELLSDTVKRFIKFWGGSRSGKTFLSIRAIRIRALKYPGSKHLVCRYSFSNAKKTIWLQTMLPQFRKDEKLGLCDILEQPGIVRYKNGSYVILGGLEPSSIDSILGAEYATIFVTEANENKWSVIESLMTRLNDTAVDDTGNMIKTLFIVDLNPTTKQSWSYKVWMLGINPEGEKPIGNFSEYGNLHFRPEDNIDNLSKTYLTTLDNLSGAKRQRYRIGDYGSYEGLVFNLDEETHIVDDFRIPTNWKKVRAIDFGYTHPFVCIWLAYDATNDCIYFYRVHSLAQNTVRAHAEHIKRLSILDLPEQEQNGLEAWRLAEKLYSSTVADHDAEDRATLHEYGIVTKQANKEVLAGIDHCIDLLDFNEHKRPRMKFFRSCTPLLNGLNTYRWRSAESKSTKPKDREIIKEDDDEVDAMRYGAMEMLPNAKPFIASAHVAH